MSTNLDVYVDEEPRYVSLDYLCHIFHTHIGLGTYVEPHSSHMVLHIQQSIGLGTYVICEEPSHIGSSHRVLHI